MKQARAQKTMLRMAQSTVLGNEQANLNLGKRMRMKKSHLWLESKFDHEEQQVGTAVCGCPGQGCSPLLQNTNLLNLDSFQIMFILQQCFKNIHIVSLMFVPNKISKEIRV